MKWVYSIKHKTRAALLLGVVLVLVLAKNLLDSSHVSQLGSSFAAVYEDRLLVESYIYQLSEHLHEKKMLVEQSYHTGQQQQLPQELKAKNAAILTLVEAYGKTTLTHEEAQFFKAFTQDIDAMQALENKYLAAAGAQEQVKLLVKEQLDAQHRLTKGHLSQLSRIQVAEGKRLNDESKQIIAGSNILTHFELALVVSLGVMIQMLVFASKSQISKFPQKPMLN
ncbi:hypothetical protein EFA69_10800 [Rufibacter immobilis]|uniref:Chemotaxis methyl-accepting receptor HlyB-like 4HB MCP domain-containing protein n=1 Tax=Rufibacter immobilis TaxID=1348778 RepID=A0A3M9MWT4_9BACT|nr:MCP four helix bundle domain-containing protein [Rufibacter immobilis]RNI30004.1 hypothetical protein EFA69_10800 [Rufibacter immobilis]